MGIFNRLKEKIKGYINKNKEFNNKDREKWNNIINNVKEKKSNTDFVSDETRIEKQKRLQQQQEEYKLRTDPTVYLGSEHERRYDELAKIFGPGGIHNPGSVSIPIEAQVEIAPMAKATILHNKGGKKNKSKKQNKTIKNKSRNHKKIKSRKMNK
jgi:hypothetical protein